MDLQTLLYEQQDNPQTNVVAGQSIDTPRHSIGSRFDSCGFVFSQELYFFRCSFNDDTCWDVNLSILGLVILVRTF